MDEFDELINQWQAALERYEDYALRLAEAEADFKAWEASTKQAIMDAGNSAAKADVDTKALDGWKERYMRLQRGQAYTETAKKAISLAQARVEVERTRQATARGLH